MGIIAGPKPRWYLDLDRVRSDRNGGTYLGKRSCFVFAANFRLVHAPSDYFYLVRSFVLVLATVLTVSLGLWSW